MTVFEGGRVDLPGGAVGSRIRDELLSVRVGSASAFNLHRGVVHAAGFAGALTVGGLRIEVLPKAFGVNSEQDGRAALLNLLRWARGDARIAWLDGSADAPRQDLLEIVQRRVMRELLRRLDAGAPRRYHRLEETGSTVKGAVDFGRYARQSPVEAHRVPIRHSPLASDNDLSRVLKALSTRIRDRASSLEVRRDADRVLDALDTVRDVPLTRELVHRIRLGRLESDWTGLVELASLLAAGRAPNPAVVGRTNQSTLLFPLNRLFELALRRTLGQSLEPPLSCPSVPGLHSFATRADTAETSLEIRPDLLIRTGNTVSAVGDAKWKVLTRAEIREGVAPPDTYQLLAYMRRFAAEVGLLFYPRSPWMEGDFRVHYVIEPYRRESLVVLAVDVVELVHPDRARRDAAGRALAARVRAELGAPT